MTLSAYESGKLEFIASYAAGTRQARANGLMGARETAECLRLVADTARELADYLAPIPGRAAWWRRILGLA